MENASVDVVVKTRRVVNRYRYDEPPHHHLSVGGGDYLVETSGYISKEQQLANLMHSGEALDAYRRNRYPGLVPSDHPEPEFDPTFRMDYDFFDVHADINYLKNLEVSDREARLRSLPEQAPPPDPEGGSTGGDSKE